MCFFGVGSICTRAKHCRRLAFWTATATSYTSQQPLIRPKPCRANGPFKRYQILVLCCCSPLHCVAYGPLKFMFWLLKTPLDSLRVTLGCSLIYFNYVPATWNVAGLLFCVYLWPERRQLLTTNTINISLRSFCTDSLVIEFSLSSSNDSCLRIITPR